MPTLVILALLATLVQPGAPSGPELHFESPPELAPARARLAAEDSTRLRDIAALVDLDDPGTPIRVVLASEGSEWARVMPSWVAGFASVEDGLIVVFPSRTPVYPHDTLEDVLRHEVAHVLIGRAAGGRPVPRWFHEGLAMAAERPWGLRDRTRLVAELAFGPRHTLASLNSLFAGNQGEQARAYAVAGALVHDLLSRHGRSLPGTLLARTASGVPFDAAFEEVTGRPLFVAEEAFWRDQRVWTTWLPIATSTTTVWLLVTLLALYARRVFRARRAVRRARWAAEEHDDVRPPEGPPSHSN